MPTLKANHRVIAAAKPVGGKRTRYRIEGVEGLWLDVSATGRRYWYVRYQPGGRQTRTERWYRLGDASSVGLADASTRARDILTDAYAKEKDPHAERAAKRSETLTLADLYQDWYDRHAEPSLARAATDQSIYRTHLENGLGKERVATLKRAEIGKLRDKVAKHSGPIASNNVLILVNRVLNWAVDEGLIEFNPAARLRKVGQVKPRERVLSEDDIVKFWNALAAMETMTGEHMARGEAGRMLSPATRSVLRLLLLTGQRRSEIVQAEKSELELNIAEPVWTIPGERTKNGLLHRLPLCPRAKAEFAKAVAASPAGSRYVFPSPVSEEDEPILATTVTRAMDRLVTQLKMSKASPHDLRRTVGTEMARLGLPVHVRSLVLNHSPMSRGITDAVYNRYAYDKEKREALMAWEERLRQLTSPIPSSVEKIYVT
ncbi:tyrosine-type recombinase/integrase [Hyphomicrobium sp. DMF-1]|uniref:tyrosine-type recombinase/integrase n=1 Tax=Hyphomicrobium sp. DMF-1 TaxID=3019544 RepID=UPI0022EBE2C0|nr:site-specific integrase [Hyphomicrobium sp. DMF-1]WBT39022.1 tyrosine-type recombinase/integrase [Hyphomicrobium sp. DMF-1]